ncbi:MAG: hypothetical protein EBY09_07075, partial [Verrucomicrobia bacterium]|nr:hypothetical protein [Verrucomicrobiota bacterium]
STTCSLDALLIPIRKHEARALGFDIIADEQSHPLFGTPMTAVSASPETSRLLEGLALRGADSLEYILLQAAAALLEHPEQLISFQALLTEMKHFEQQSSGLRSDTMSRFFISPPKLHQLLCTMIKEHLAITDLPLILQTISEVCIAHKISAADDTDVALKPLLDHVRRKLSRRFTQSIPDIGTRPMVFVLSDAFVKLLETARYDELLRSMTIDEAALNHLKEANIDKATEIWEKLIKDNSITAKNYSAAINLSTLQLGLHRLRKRDARPVQHLARPAGGGAEAREDQRAVRRLQPRWLSLESSGSKGFLPRERGPEGVEPRQCAECRRRLSRGRRQALLLRRRRELEQLKPARRPEQHRPRHPAP